jgi:hypothetical protein
MDRLNNDEGAETLSSLNSSKGDRQSNLRPLYPGGLLMPAVEIEAFAGGLHVSESALVQHLLHHFPPDVLVLRKGQRGLGEAQPA